MNYIVPQKAIASVHSISTNIGDSHRLDKLDLYFASDFAALIKRLLGVTAF
jgi:hypothetical protein